MALSTWVYSDYITYPTGSATGLARLRLHIQEVSDRFAQLNQYAIKGREVNPEDALLTTLLSALIKKEQVWAEQADMAAGTRLGWTNGRAIQ